MTELEKLRNGEEYCFWDSEVNAQRLHAIDHCAKLNSIDQKDEAALAEEIKVLFGSCGEDAWIASGFHCDWGTNIHVGYGFMANYNVSILDIAPVYMGDHVWIGPHCVLTTVNHPLSPKGRRDHMGIAKPIHIGNDVWMGANVTVLPGVTIGNNVVIAAGAVVNKDIPDNVVVGGIPARIIKTIENDLE